MPMRPDPNTPSYFSRWQQLARYAGFGDDHARTLAALAPHLAPHFPAIVDAFYAAVEREPEAKAVFVGGDAQIQRQKAFLREWLQDLFSGRYDEDYVVRHARIGRTHVQIGLQQRFMFSAMALVRGGLLAALDSVESADIDQRAARSAIDVICDLELAIMLETYSDHIMDLMRAKERLATLGQLAGFVGHELRNPLAVMETSLHLLGKRLKAPDERAQRHLHRLSEQVALSGRIISGLLELTRDREPEREQVRLPEALEGALRAIPGSDQLQIVQDFAPEARAPWVDPTHLHHLLVNLLTNAAHAISEGIDGSQIWVRAEADGSALVLQVEDEGPGFPEGTGQKLFEPLHTGRAQGIGLGLALCRKIAEKHGGSIRAENRAEGGARITVRFANAFRGES